jgi:hypothetical protein
MGYFHHKRDEYFFLLKIAHKNGRKGDPIKGSLLRRILHNHDLKNAQLPNAIENDIQINRTFFTIMGSNAKISFEEKKFKTWIEN